MPRQLSRRFVMVGAAGLTAGCGFHPLYGSGVAQRDLAAVQISLIPDRAGQLLRQALQQRFDRGQAVPKRFSLDVSYGVAGDAIGVQQDSTSTRVREIATATWFLKDLNPERTLVVSGAARALDGVNVVDQQYFAADLEGEAATRRAAERIADQITQQLASYFARRSTAS